MKILFQGFEFIRANIYEVLISIKGDWTDHEHKLSLTLNQLK